MLSRKEEAIALEREGEEGMVHSLLSGLPEIFEEGDDETAIPLGEGNSVLSPEEVETTNVDEDTPTDSNPQSSPAAQNVLPEAPEGTPPTATDATQDLPTLQDGESLEAETDLETSTSQAGETDDTLPVEQHSTADTTEGDSTLLLEPTPADPGDLNLKTKEVPTAAIPPLPYRPSSPPPIPSPPSSSARPASPTTPPVVRQPRVSLSHLLRTADSLYETYPPTHPSVAVNTIMGPQSVMFTWSEHAEDLPSDNDAERMVLRPDLIVLPLPDIDDPSKEHLTSSEDEKPGRTGKKEKRKRRKLRKPLPLAVRRKTMVASAVLVLGVAMAVYGTGGFQRGMGLGLGGDRHGAGREWKTFRHFVGAIVVGATERLLDSVWR